MTMFVLCVEVDGILLNHPAEGGVKIWFFRHKTMHASILSEKTTNNFAHALNLGNG